MLLRSKSLHAELVGKELTSKSEIYSLRTTATTAFEFSKPKTSCSKLLDENLHPTTDPSTILELFKSYFSKLASSNIDASNQTPYANYDIDNLEASSFTHDDQILDIDINVEEIEAAINTLKRGRSKGADGLNSEHLIYGGPSLILWLKKIFNTIILLEEVPTCFKEGIVTPVYKGKGKDPLLTSSYRGITLSSIMAKTLEIFILNRMSPVLDEIGFPDINQTAYQKGISCADAILFFAFTILKRLLTQLNSLFYCTIYSQSALTVNHGASSNPGTNHQSAV